MTTFTPKSFPNIVGDMAATVAANTPVNDFTPGSIILTLLETAAQEDYQQYIQMIEVIRNYNLDTTEGSALDSRAFEFGLRRLTSRPHSGYVTIQDTRFTTISTKLYAGLSGPTSGSSVIYVDDASSLPSTGSIYIGRGTSNLEGPITYSTAPIDNTAYWTITLDTLLLNDHGTDESIVLSQYGVRVVKAGAEVRIPENDFSTEVIFELNQTVEFVDGVDSLDNVLVTALVPGSTKVPKGSIREFTNPPFSGASVYNYSPFVNGRDAESDQELRDRIRQTIQSLSRGTGVAVQNGILGIIDPASNSSITSANVVVPVTLADGPTKVYIDNGRGLEPQAATFGLETLQAVATGGERFFQLGQFPVIKANVISQLVAPFDLVGGETIILRVGVSEETFTFAATDFNTIGSATASEVAQAINARATLFESRTMTDSLGSRIFITPKATQNEDISLDASSTANVAFNFSTKDIYTLKLYKNDILLAKDGLTASILSASDPYDMSSSEYTTVDDVTIASGSKVVTNVGSIDDYFSLVKPGDYVKSSADTDNFYTKVKAVPTASKILLDTAYPTGSSAVSLGKLNIWTAPQLEIAGNGDLEETEVISFSKNDFATPAQALASEVIVRIQKELNLSEADLAVNNRKIILKSYLKNSANSKMQAIGGHAAYALGFTTRYSLTGNLAVNSSSTQVTGTGTLFTQELKEGQWIRINGQNNGSWTKIQVIESDTKLYLATAYKGLTATSTAEAMYLGTESVGSNKDYTLNRSNGQIELVTPLVAGNSLTAGSINTRAFSNSVAGPYNFDSLGSFSTLIVRVDGGIPLTATTADSVSPYSRLVDLSKAGYPVGSFVGYHLECTSGNNAGQVEYIGSYNPTTGEFLTNFGFTNPILVGDRFVLSQVIEFVHSTDFVDPKFATATEVIATLNSRLSGATAQQLISGGIRVRTNNLKDGQFKVISGTAQGVLNFTNTYPVNQESNIAYEQTSNSDREGLSDAPGFTLSPTQNLVVVFDDDTANKTFSTVMRIEAPVTSGTTGSFTSSELAAKYPKDGTFLDFWIYWKTGASNVGRLALATGYTGSTGTVTFSTYYPSGASAIAPVATDVVQLVPRTAENLITLLNDSNTTTMGIAGDISATGPTGELVQIASRRPGTNGKVNVRGGSANSLGIPIQGPVPGSPVNDVYVNSISGLNKGLPVRVTTDSLDQVYFVSNIVGTTSPYVVSLQNKNGTVVDTTTFTTSNHAKILGINNLEFSTIQVEGVDGYKFYDGLIKLAQWTIDGLDRDRSNYEGIGASGTQFEVISPVLLRLKLVINITPVDGISLSSIGTLVSSKIQEYVNSRKVGEDVILSEIIAAAQAVQGVFDAKISNLTSNVTVADGELARLADSDLVIG